MKNETVKSNVPKMTVRINDKAPHKIGRASSLHYHDELEFLPVYKGSFVCTVDGVDYVAREGEIIFINSGIPHETKSEEYNESGLLQFRESDFLDKEISRLIKYSVRFQGLSGAPVRILRSPELFEAIDNIRNESVNGDKAYEFYIKAEIYKILGYLYRANILSDAEQLYNTKEVQKTLPALAYVNERYAENLTLEEVSDLLGFDRSYFCRMFKSATGATFTEYLNFVRICKAERLLSKTQDSILSISEAVGFSSVSYFNRIFKKYRNCSPRYYRSARYVAISKGEQETDVARS